MNVTICNMVMIEDADTGRILVQHRLPKATNPWCGLTFPGGHVEELESVVDSAVREVREETGLTVSKLRLCGMVEWLTPGKPSEDAPAEVTAGSRYIVYLFRTRSFIGKLKSSPEGRCEWMKLDEMRAGKMAPHMEEYIRVLLEDDAVEAFGFSGQGLEVLHGEQSARSKDCQFANMLKDRVDETGKQPQGGHAKPEQGLLFRVAYCDAPSRLAELELPGDSTFANLHKTISSLVGNFLGSSEYEFLVSDCLHFLPHKGRTDYEQSAQQRLWKHLYCGQKIDYSFNSVLYGTQRMTIEVLDIIPGRNQDEYPLILNQTPDFKLGSNCLNDGKDA